MPELPEVESTRRALAEGLVGRTLAQVRIADDRIVFDEDAPRRVSRHLRGRRVEALERRGKYLWWVLDRGPHPLFHLGMTGGFHRRGVEALRLKAHGGRGPDAWPPRFVKLHATLDDGGEIAFVDPRRFGRIRLRTDPVAAPPIEALGPDALDALPSARVLGAQLAARRAPIKAVLLDQSLFAGVGNWIADEVLYQAGVAPQRTAASLSAPEVARLRSRLRAILVKAVAVQADKSRFPRTWLFHHRWGKDAEARTARGERIVHETIGGRTTAWVPQRQA